ncbi:conserved hypothetical protein [Uncinocarpus reesii 1704]|uniref:Meiotic recombination protein DMC1 n=1 Tax=Uncinocarpus reesii (strain UAMH 1704) TaxID=336963 RepID=C4JKF3_UNCRE|nr:uncharacterized protein UREG_02110 [Uncinocarpus reesii 1704]EEP77261.1 conserved hypothetical protein [Uncinocarpus reesii 1704]
MGRDYPLNISGYTVLPLELPPLPSLPKPATHFLYLQPHQPKIPDPAAARSLFIVNVPITSTEIHFRHLFGIQLSAGRVESVRFHEASGKESGAVAPAPNPDHTRGKKRKRETAEELEKQLETIQLPHTWDREIHTPGAHAVVVFVDKPSMETSLKAAKKAAKSASKIVWGEGIETRLPPLGLQRYENHIRLKYPPKEDLLRMVNEYMTIYDRLEQARAREATAGGQVPDADGFITVVKGPKRNPDREEELKALAEKQKDRNKGLEDFYRFQMRERRKEKQNQLVKQFEADKKKVEEMKKRRGKIRPE